MPPIRVNDKICYGVGCVLRRVVAPTRNSCVFWFGSREIMSLASLGEEVLPFLSPDCSLPRTRKGQIRAVGVQWSQRTLWNLPVARTTHASTRPADGGRVVQVDPCNDRSIDNFQRMEVTSMPSISLQGEVTKRTPRTPELEELPICAPSLIL